MWIATEPLRQLAPEPFCFIVRYPRSRLARPSQQATASRRYQKQNCTTLVN
jgi:hypothetical protein